MSKYLRRDSDEISWISTELMLNKESPFYNIGSVIGKRSTGRHVTLQNLYRSIHLLTADQQVSCLSKKEKLAVALTYFDSIKNRFINEWSDYKDFRLTHIVCLDALSIAGLKVILTCIPEGKKHVDLKLLTIATNKLDVDWSSKGPLKYIKGMSGSRMLAEDFRDQMLA
ncbi:hypothetical protein [Cohnella sp. JJ-181]|uniref:hypothetical protein n=1 Tax=Cohnella rhizoplanae TaxID=2974897 RepID=UPI00232B5DC8|nr:hypothetical protein [Cohnella sp. JJ-181]